MIFTIAMLLLAVFMACLSSLFGIASSAGDSLSPIEIFYWYILPALPFIILMIFHQTKKNMSVIALSCAAVAASLAISAPFLLIYLDGINYSGGGANIGLGLLYLAMPIYVPIFMVVGYGLGNFIKPS